MPGGRFPVAGTIIPGAPAPPFGRMLGIGIGAGVIGGIGVAPGTMTVGVAVIGALYAGAVVPRLRSRPNNPRRAGWAGAYSIAGVPADPMITGAGAGAGATVTGGSAGVATDAARATSAAANRNRFMLLPPETP